MNTHEQHFRTWLAEAVGEAKSLLGPIVGTDFAEPMGTQQAAMLAAALGYEFDVQRVNRAVQRGNMPKPAKAGQEWAWRDADLIAYLLDAERRRDWLPGDKLHAHKLTCFERDAAEQKLEFANALLGDAPTRRPDYATMEPKRLIVEAIEADRVQDRRWAMQCFRAKLGLVTDHPDPMVQAALVRIADEEDKQEREAMGLLLLRRLQRADEARVRTVAAMLHDLRSGDAATREAAGLQLAASVVTGLRLSGASDEDAEHGAGRDLREMIEQAVMGDARAVDQLERVLTTDARKAQRTPAEAAREIEA